MENEGNIILDGLNPAQKEAVMCLTGPSLIVAGAGSGKTKVLTCKIANILSHGYKPYCVLALTFTNKAAREMKERIGQMVGDRLARRIYMGTFHSVFLRFLRQYAHLLGYPPEFTVYDKSDSKSLVKRCIKELELDDTVYKNSEIANRISGCKNNLISPEEYLNHPELMESDKRSRRPRIQEVYALYQRRCKEQAIMDFDDILLNMYRLLATSPEFFADMKGRFQFILVDEYQDTNSLQYNILRALAQDHHNITVVGDDAQSIYAFRGAKIENILNFQKDYPDSKVFRLERNYRSTQTIVDAANSLISKNKGRITKECFSKREQGEKIELIQAYTEQEEALLVASAIQTQMYKSRVGYESFAILYRTNAQSRLMEEALRKKNMPYKIYAGHSFYDRDEIKRLVCYLRLIVNPLDDEAFKKTVNYPHRGIGATSMERLIAAAQASGKSLTQAAMELTAEQLNIKPATLSKIKDFAAKADSLRANVMKEDAYTIAMRMDTLFGITEALRLDTSIEGQNKLDNVLELFNSIKEFVEEGNEEFGKYLREEQEYATKQGSAYVADEYVIPQIVTLDLYLQNIALIADSDSARRSSEISEPAASADKDLEANRISLMTVHSAKGLEFPYVFVLGMEESLFPLYTSSGVALEKEIEEERRLFYVALTRAENGVWLSFARSRMRNGSYVNNRPSRFIKEIDKCFILNPLSDEVYHNASHTTTSFGGVWSSGFNTNTRPSRASGLSSGIRYSSSSSSAAFAPKPSVSSSSSSSSSFAATSAAAQPKRRDENFVADAPIKMKAGMRVEHERFGFGQILSVTGNAGDLKAVVEFEQHGRKTLLLKFARMRIV